MKQSFTALESGKAAGEFSDINARHIPSMSLLRQLTLIIFFASVTFISAYATQPPRPIKIAVLDLGTTTTAHRVTKMISRAISADAELSLMDRDESGAAVRGIGYNGSLNLTLEDARNLGAAIGCDFYITGDAQTIRRSSSARPIFYESYASIFVVSSRTGRLLTWGRPSFEAPTSAEAETLLMGEVTRLIPGYIKTIRAAEVAERSERELSVTIHAPVIEEIPDEASPLSKGLRLPQPYRRLRPSYPDTAKIAEAEATVDALVDLDVEGEVVRVEVVRWAGFGLDEETSNTIRRMHFRPAMRDGVPFPMRVLLRYNFTKPKKPNVEAEKPTATAK